MSGPEPNKAAPFVPAPGVGVPERDFSDRPIPPSAVVRVQVPLPCVECSYDLRGIDESAACPECGTPVGRSTSRDLLRFSPMSYLQSLRLGGRCLALSLWSALALVLIGMVGTVAIGLLSSGSNGADRAIAIAVIAYAASLALCGGIWVFGWWKLTAMDGSRPPTTQGREARVIVRWSAVAALVLLLPVLGTLIAKSLVEPSASGVTPNRFDTLLKVFVCIFGVFGCIHLIATCIHARALFRRIPYPIRARFAGRIAIVIPIAVACLLLPYSQSVWKALPALTFLLYPLGWVGAIVSLSFYVTMVTDLSAAAKRIVDYRTQWSAQFEEWERREDPGARAGGTAERLSS